MSIPINTCLVCGEPREVAKAQRLRCEDGERHRWRSWTDKELAVLDILPEFFEFYRRADPYDLLYTIHCHHRGREHPTAEELDPRGQGLPDHVCPSCHHDKTDSCRATKLLA